eukprot:15475938-Alexandrium_andersonii.AAC.1
MSIAGEDQALQKEEMASPVQASAGRLRLPCGGTQALAQTQKVRQAIGGALGEAGGGGGQLAHSPTRL